MHRGDVLKSTGSMNAAFVEGACRVIEFEDKTSWWQKFKKADLE